MAGSGKPVLGTVERAPLSWKYRWKHARVKQPTNTGSSFFCYKKFFSIVLLAVADADGTFISIDVGDYGRNSDGHVLRNSHFGKALNAGKLDLPAENNFPGQSKQYPFFIGDSGFPLTKNLQRPFEARNSTAKEKSYNYRLSRARKSVECAFGMMAAKFRCFHAPLACNITKATNIVKAACVMHNVIRKMEGKISTPSYVISAANEYNEERKKVFHSSSVAGSSTSVTNDGRAVRQVLATFFLNEVSYPITTGICRPSKYLAFVSI